MLTIVLAVSTLLQPGGLRQERAALDRERNPQRLEAAAVAIASSSDSAALRDLAEHLSKRSFLRRLDPAQGSVEPVVRVGTVFRALAEHPSPASVALSLTVAASREFTSVPSRMNFVLAALAAVRPMSESSAKLFRETSRTGYFEVNGPLLVKNASPLALDVFADMLASDSVNVAQRVSTAHWSILPMRTDAGVAGMAARLLATPGLSREVAIAVLESLFDYQPRPWFGVRGEQPTPPSWSTASAATRETLRSLGNAALRRADLPPRLTTSIRNTLEELR